MNWNEPISPDDAATKILELADAIDSLDNEESEELLTEAAASCGHRLASAWRSLNDPEPLTRAWLYVAGGVPERSSTSEAVHILFGDDGFLELVELTDGTFTLFENAHSENPHGLKTRGQFRCLAMAFAIVLHD